MPAAPREIPRITWEQIGAGLDEFLAFAGEVGLAELIHRGRFGEYRRRVATLIEVVSRRRAGETVNQRVLEHLGANTTLYRSALSEALEAGSLVQMLRGCDVSIITNKLREVLAGPPLAELGDRLRNDA